MAAAPPCGALQTCKSKTGKTQMHSFWVLWLIHQMWVPSFRNTGSENVNKKYMSSLCFLSTGQTCKYQEWWHHRWQPQTDPGIDLDNHFALSGQCFYLMVCASSGWPELGGTMYIHILCWWCWYIEYFRHFYLDDFQIFLFQCCRNASHVLGLTCVTVYQIICRLLCV